MQESKVQSLAPRDLEAHRKCQDATRLAAQGKYRCHTCNKVDEIQEGVIIAYLGNILLSICPGCITGPIRIDRSDTKIKVIMPRAEDSSIILASDLSRIDEVVAAKPQVIRTKLEDL